MTTSAEIWILSRLAELAQRCGLNPINADVSLYHHIPEDQSRDDHYYMLSGIGGEEMFATDEEAAPLLKMWSLLGLGDAHSRRFNNLSEVAEAIDRALSLAPRARTR
jgi:hypothetical protein